MSKESERDAERIRAGIFFRRKGLVKDMDYLLPLGVVALYFVAMKWLLPAFGVPT
ncbi:MAG TPA: hypothetical protein VGE01_09535 [Fimbriimonas sp.]